jgi:RimJ/RimL family protein N-acetyltransferase
MSMAEIETEQLTLRPFSPGEAVRALLSYRCRALHLDQIAAMVLPDNKPSERVIHRLGLPYIEDRMHAGLTHRFYALSRETYFSAHGTVRKKA